jgi:6-phosphogluconolactonase
MIHPDPANRFVLQTDLGQDRIYVYRFDKQTGQLGPADTPFISLPTGDGPRHFVFHPHRGWMYSIQEEASTIVFFHYQPETGSLTPQQSVSTLPKGFTGTNFCSAIMLSTDARFLYAANRLHNSIAVFAVGTQGHLEWVGEAWTRGDYPSHFNLDPSGTFLYACNPRSDQITSFRIDKETGLLTFTGRYTPVGTPLCITFLA